MLAMRMLQRQSPRISVVQQIQVCGVRLFSTKAHARAYHERNDTPFSDGIIKSVYTTQVLLARTNWLAQR